MTSYETRKTPGNTQWFTMNRFGMFIHFGLYSMGARHEWLKAREFMPEEMYQRYFEHFNPDLCDPAQWAKMAKAAGMKYALLTSKHHEGFCLFDSKYTDYKVTNTPYGKDIVRQFVDAFRAEGLKVGFYYSLLDWHHPDFPIDKMHPRRFDENAEELDRGRDMKKYAQYMRDQVTELLTNYGKIDILWFDFSYDWEPKNAKEIAGTKPWMQFGGRKGKDQWEAEELIALARRLQPDIMLNNRTDIEQDISTPEQFQPLEWPKHEQTGELLLWEACQTMSGSWGYNRDETSWKTPEMLIQMLVNTVALGGNLIMNVGPTGRGDLDYRAKAALQTYEQWMHYHSRSIYGCTMAEPEFTAPKGTVLTQSRDSKRLYIHLFEYPYAYLNLDNLAGKIRYAQFLHDGSEILYTERVRKHHAIGGDMYGENMVFFKIPDLRPNISVPVIEVFLK